MQTPCTSPYHICDKVVSLVNGANRQYKPTSSRWLNYNSGEWWLINSILRIKLIKQVTLINLNLIDPAEETSHSHHVSLQPFQSYNTLSGTNANWLYSLHLSCGKVVSLVYDNKLFLISVIELSKYVKDCSVAMQTGYSSIHLSLGKVVSLVNDLKSILSSVSQLRR